MKYDKNSASFESFGSSYYRSNGITLAEYVGHKLRVRVDYIPADDLPGFVDWLNSVKGIVSNGN